ncbi:MAG: outer membrane lipoprotein carrier protein LolA [Pseudomonadota bacterium]
MRSVVLGALLALGMSSPALAEKISLSAISSYLNDLRTAKGEFTQINADGTISTGTIYIHRPGRIRFEYNPPEETLVMAGGSQVAVFDGRAVGNPDVYPLKRTPLNLILARNIDLAANNLVVRHFEEGVSTKVIAQDPDTPEFGTIELVFTGNPVELRQWVITDEVGSETTLVLGALETGLRLPASLFSIVQETQNWD